MNRRLGLILTALALFILAYTAYWYEVAGRAVRAFESWQQAETQGGATVKAGLSRAGFPWTVTLKLKDFFYEKPGVLRVASPLVNMVLPAPTPFRPTFTSNETTSFYFAKAQYTLTTQSFSATMLKPWVKARSIRDTGYVAKISLYNVGLDPAYKVALGNLVQELSLRAKLKGPLPDFSSKPAVEGWRDAGGFIEIRPLHLAWGSLNVDGDGTLALNKNLQPLTSLSAAITGHEQAIDVMRDQGQLQPLPASLIKAALKLLEAPEGEKNAARKLKIPVTIQDNALSIAGVTLMNWEPYPWP